MTHRWTKYRTHERCTRCKLRRKRVREVSFNTGRLRWFKQYRGPHASVWSYAAGEPICPGFYGGGALTADLWSCPDCAFSFSRVHEDVAGGYSCPLCAQHRMVRELGLDPDATIEQASDRITELRAEARRSAEWMVRIGVDNAVCICGCPPEEHESDGEHGESCANERHECIRVCVAAAQIAGELRSRVETLEQERADALEGQE